MNEVLKRTARSSRVIAWININLAKKHRSGGNARMASYHLNVAKASHRDAVEAKTLAKSFK
jgi:hypothetical protein